MTNNPEIAILLATYNGEKYLKQQLDSLLNQTNKYFRCFIHDDGSTDSTNLILDDYAEKHPDRIIIINGEKCGSSKENFSFLLKNVEADFYFFCDQDDIWFPDKVEKCIRKIREKACEKPILIYTDLQVVDENLKIINHSFYEFSNLNPFLNTYKDLLMSNVCVGCTMVINRMLRDILIDFDSKNIIMHDWEAALIASLLGELDYINIATIQYRQHQHNVVGATKEKSFFNKIIRARDFIGYIERKKYYKNRPIKMAQELLNLPGLDDEKREFLLEFSNISEKTKTERIFFYHKNKLYRQRINKMWQLMGI